jgi:hypothetical protein
MLRNGVGHGRYGFSKIAHTALNKDAGRKDLKPKPKKFATQGEKT